MPQTVNIREDTWWTVFGAMLAIIGCIFQAIGFIMQKIAHNKIEQYNINQQKKSVSHIVKQSDQHSISPNSKYRVKKIASDDLDETESSNSYNNTSDNNHNTNINAIEMKQKTKKKLNRKKKKYIQSKLWLAGFFINGIIGSLLNIIALNYAPQSVVLPLSATTLVGNTILATKYLNEPFPMQDFIGILLVIIGSIGTIIVGPKESHNSTQNENQLRWQNLSFLVFFSLITFIIIMDFILIQIFNGINNRKKQQLFAKEINTFDGKEIGEYTIVYCQCFYLISYPLIAAYFASLNFLVLKSFIHIIDTSIKDKHRAVDNFTKQWLTYVYIIVIIVINFLLEMYRQKGLRAFGAIYIIPIFQVFVITLGTTMGAIYFSEMEHMNIIDSCLFICSVFITCIGVIVLALSNNINKLLKNANCGKYLLTASNESDSEEIEIDEIVNNKNSIVIQTQTNQNNIMIISHSELEAIQI